MIDTFETLEFFRGFTRKFPTGDAFIRSPRIDRRPRDLELNVHLAADEWFFNRFGVRYRSQGLFLTSSKFTASGYSGAQGQIARIVPLGPYRYCWSTNVRDLLHFVKEAAVNTVAELLSTANFIETDLRAAWQCGNELMLYCAKYVAIPEDMGEPSRGTKLLLPGAHDV